MQVPNAGCAIIANHFNENAGTLQFSASASLAPIGDAAGHAVRIDFEWSRGNPGHLQMWRTRFVDGAPDATGTVALSSVDLPGMQSASISNVFAGFLNGHDFDASGVLSLDEFVFRR